MSAIEQMSLKCYVSVTERGLLYLSYTINDTIGIYNVTECKKAKKKKAACFNGNQVSTGQQFLKSALFNFVLEQSHPNCLL